MRPGEFKMGGTGMAAMTQQLKAWFKDTAELILYCCVFFFVLEAHVMLSI